MITSPRQRSPGRVACALALAFALWGCGGERRPPAVVDDVVVTADLFVAGEASVGFDASVDRGAPAQDVVDATAPDRMRYEDVSLPDDLSYPEGPYGPFMGDRFAPFSLPDCFGNNVSFADDRFFLSRASLVVLYAGFCAQCMTESRDLEATVARPFADQRVRVMAILVEGTQPTEPPTTHQCLDWQRNANAALHRVLTDPTSSMRNRFGGRYPVYLLVDGRGVIRWRTSNDLTNALQQARQQVQTFLDGSP